MDTVRALDDGHTDTLADDSGIGEPTINVGTDERRMHVRAYNHWVSLLKGRPYPSIEDLDPAGIADFGAHSVLLDFTQGVESPLIRFLGRALREECEIDHSIARIADVPARSLLSRLTDHYLQIIANCAPIGFEAEFVGTRGHTMLYRGILMPLSSTGETIDFIYGVINWKELVDAATQAQLDAELDAAVRAQPANAPTPEVWADGPSAGQTVVNSVAPQGLADQLMLARESAAMARAADTRSRAALYRALGRAHAFAVAAVDDTAGYAALLADAGITAQTRAPMTPIVKLVFGADYDKTRLTEFAAVLSHAARSQVPAEGLGEFIEGFPGGIKGIVTAERQAKRPAATVDRFAQARAEFAARPVLGAVSVPAEEGAFVVLVARGRGDGTVEVLGAVENQRLVEAAVRAAA